MIRSLYGYGWLLVAAFTAVRFRSLLREPSTSPSHGALAFSRTEGTILFASATVPAAILWIVQTVGGYCSPFFLVAAPRHGAAIAAAWVVVAMAYATAWYVIVVRARANTIASRLWYTVFFAIPLVAWILGAAAERGLAAELLCRAG